MIKPTPENIAKIFEEANKKLNEADIEHYKKHPEDFSGYFMGIKFNSLEDFKKKFKKK